MELVDQRVKLSPRSITVKDSEGKTSGVVKAKRWGELSTREQADNWKSLKRAGIWGNRCGATHLIDRVYSVNGKLYFFNNKKYHEDHKKYFSNIEEFPAENKAYCDYSEMLKKASSFLTIIDCYIN